MSADLSAREAKRYALSAQGFHAQPRDRTLNWSHLAKALQHMNLLQIDSVNVAIRSHYMPLYSRLGAYDRKRLDAKSMGAQNRALFECWAHEASLVPMALHPLMRWRMVRAQRGDTIYRSFRRFAKDEAAYLKKTLRFVEKNGPTAVRDLPDAGQGAGGWWGWSKGKLALEVLFDQGLVTAAARPNFERLYDVPERVIDTDILSLPTPDEADGFRQLIELAALSYGVATEADLRDYFRLPLQEARTALRTLVEDGTLQQVRVEGWSHPAYMHKEFRLARAIGGATLLSPFDPLVWNRERAERLFNFRYRLEIYTPAHKRIYGYYVMPFLLNDSLVARVCLKADRQRRLLLVNASHIEPQQDEFNVADALFVELQRMARWLGLDGLTIQAQGNLSPALRALP